MGVAKEVKGHEEADHKRHRSFMGKGTPAKTYNTSAQSLW